MFTGIVTDIGTVVDIAFLPDMYIWVKTSYDVLSVDIGASIACQGICLTVIEKKEDHVRFCLSLETYHKTNAQFWNIGQKLNTERALKIGDELGGHIVTGHIDGLAEIMTVEAVQTSRKITIKPPENCLEFIAVKGSVCLDGISLTVNQLDSDCFSVTIIPHTQQVTTWQTLEVGDMVNIEIDMMARYACRYFSYHSITQ